MMHNERLTPPSNIEQPYIPADLKSRKEIEEWTENQIKFGRASKPFVGHMITLDILMRSTSYIPDALERFKEEVEASTRDGLTIDEKETVLARAERVLGKK